MNYVKLIFELKNDGDADLLSAIFSEFDCQGMEEIENSLLVFFYENAYDQALVDAQLEAYSFVYRKELIPHENWNAQWESNFEPIRIGDEVGVRADFHQPFTDCLYDIVITPKMSFGTGHHETTQMMLEYGIETDFTGKSVLDFGCGTGVLAILASLKGASHVIGIDNDDWSVENAKENCLKNDCNLIVISGADIQTLEPGYDIILANINLNILLDHFVHMRFLLNPGGQIFISGLLASDLAQISECFTGLGFELVSQKQKKDWIALHVN